MNDAFTPPADEADDDEQRQAVIERGRRRARGGRGYVGRAQRGDARNAAFLWINLFAALTGGGGILMVTLGLLALIGVGGTGEGALSAAILVGIGALVVVATYGLVARRRWAIIPGYLLAVISLAGIPLGTFIGIMFLLTMPKAKKYYR